MIRLHGTAALAMALGLAPSVLAEVDMKTVPVCAAAWDGLDPAYKNNNPGPVEMHGWGATIGGTKVRGSFDTQGKEFNMIPAGGTAGHFGPNCTAAGPVIRQQLESKLGSCNELDPPAPPGGLQCSELPAAVSYDEARCVRDGLGVGRGDGYGGIIDSWAGETQLQVRMPATSFTRNGQAVRFDPAKMGGPLYMMAVAAVQEYLYVDMQFLLALGASKTGAGLVDASGASIYASPANTGTGDGDLYTSFGINHVTLRKLANAYPKFVPPINSINDMVSTGGTGPTQANSVQQVNSAVLGALNLWWYLDAVQQGANLCFRQYVRTAADKSAGLKVLLAGYENGPATGGGTADFATQVLPAAPGSPAMTQADVTNLMKPYLWGAGTPDNGTTLYVQRVFDALNLIANAGNTCGSAPIYDSPITLQQVRELFFGQGGTQAAQGKGGLLWHLKITPAQRTELWTALECAFNKLAGQSPSTKGTANISFRYDFLPVLRAARPHLAGFLNKFQDKPTETFGEYSGWVAAHSNAPCASAVPDNTWPTLVLSADTIGLGMSVEGPGTTDNKGIKSREYTQDKDWVAWVPVAGAGFTVPATMPAGQRLWYRVTDSCGNSTIQEVLWRDLPKLPQVVATPPGGPFYSPPTVTLEVPGQTGVTIHYTTDGTTPTTASPTYPGTPVTIPLNMDFTLRAIAVKSGFRPSDPASWSFIKSTLPTSGAPTIAPADRTFHPLQPAFNVTMTHPMAGARILYSRDGAEPDTVVNARTFAYSGPIPFNPATEGASVTFKAIALVKDHLPVPSATRTYTRENAPRWATPVATPPGAGVASHSFLVSPLAVTLVTSTPGAAIKYRLDDAAPADYGAPLALDRTVTLKAWAEKAEHLPSDTLTVRFTYTPPVGVRKAWYLDKDGDGRIESAVVEYDKPMPASPDSIGFAITDERGVSQARTARAAEIARDGSRVTVTFASPFDFGITSVANSGSSGIQYGQASIPLMAGSFAVDDSVAPVIVKAEVFEPDSGRPLKQVVLEYSEPVTFPAGSPTAIVFKRGPAEMGEGQVRFVGDAAPRGATGWVFSVDSASNLMPIVKDSVAINTDRQTRDRALNAPSRKLFRVLEGDPPRSKPSRVYVTFPYGTHEVPKVLPPEPSVPPGMYFVPVNRDGGLLPSMAGACASCQVGGNDGFAGPVIFAEIPGAADIEFRIFNNLGEFIVSGKVRIDEADLAALGPPVQGGTLFRARIVWTGLTSKDTKAGTGAYILQAVVRNALNLRTGAPPSTDTHRIRFGMLRNYRGL